MIYSLKGVKTIITPFQLVVKYILKVVKYFYKVYLRRIPNADKHYSAYIEICSQTKGL